MKKLSFIFLIFLFVACNNNGVSVPELKFNGMKGNVARVKESKHEAKEKFGEVIPGNLIELQVHDFDEDGHWISTNTYDEDGDREWAWEANYENGLLASVDSWTPRFQFHSTQKVIERKKNYIKWDDHEEFYDGLHKKEVFDNFSCEFSYDKNGRVLSVLNIKENGDTTYRIIKKFDKNGVLVREENNGSVRTYSYKEFDNKGNWVKAVCTEGDDMFLLEREIQYR